MKFLLFICLSLALTFGCESEKSQVVSNDSGEIQLMKKRILLDESRILFAKDNFQAIDTGLFTFHHSEWLIEDGWLVGKNQGNHPGMAILKQSFPGNVLVEFEAMTIPPSTHDINVMWNGEWIDSIDQRGTAYVAGLEGWWNGKVGIERSPEYKLMFGTPLFDFKPGKLYKIQARSVDGHCFILANGQLLLEGMDPDPIDNQKYTKVGFEAYASQIKLRDVKIRQILLEPIDMKYENEF